MKQYKRSDQIMKLVNKIEFPEKIRPYIYKE